MAKIDFNKGVNIRIDGDIGAYNTLPIEYLVKLATDLQNLVVALAAFEVPSAEIANLKNFKIELSGFKKGSAVPQFIFTPHIENIMSIDSLESQRVIVNEKFNNILEIANNGNYRSLKDVYPEASQRNHIVEPLYKLTNELIKAQGSFVKVIGENNYESLYIPQRFKPEVRDSLVENILTPLEEFVNDSDKFGLAKVKMFSNTGRKLRKPSITEIFTSKKNSIDYSPEVLIYKDKIYSLNFPLRCLFDKEDDYYVIKCEILDIIGTGLTEDEAEQNFAEEFDFIYKRYNELPNESLSPRIQAIKSALSLYIKNIK